jgi:lysozyme family protein
MAALTAGLRKEYQLLYESCLPRPARTAAVDALVRKLKSARPRYERVAGALGMPWYVVGVIHNLEASGNFSAHLHNGDPLRGRTTHVPAGRPKKGAPPFTWEESATDALTFQGFGSWKDWSVPGILYKLEAYNGWGYRNHHPDVRSPYLWSFSNHYTRGKYVADGTFSPTAVSAQCGAAVLLKRLRDGGEVVDVGPRVLQLTNPNLSGPDVEAAQTLLKSNPFGSFDPGDVDGVYGPTTAGAVRRAKWELGYANAAVNMTFGPDLKAYLDGKKALPAAAQERRRARLQSARSERAIRKRIVEWALWGSKNSAQIGYTQNGTLRLDGLASSAKLPLATDCSAFATLCYAWAGAPNPNADGAFDPHGLAYTGSLLTRCRHIPRSAVQAGDLVVWSPPKDGHHVCVVVTPGPDPMLVSHGDPSGPKKLRFSAEDAAQRRRGHDRVTWLSAF